MKKILLLPIIALSAIGCGSGIENSDKQVENAFHKYVETDFDDSDVDYEITSIEKYDSLTKDMALKTIRDMEDLSDYLGQDELDKLAQFKSEFSNIEKSLYLYEIKVRIELERGKRIEEYYAVHYDEKTKIYRYKPFIAATMGVYKDFYTFCLKIIGKDLDNTK